MSRFAAVTDNFKVPALVCINKYDINEENTKDIEEFCKQEGIPIVGKIPYDDTATQAMMAEKTVVEFSEGPMAEEIKSIWQKVKSALFDQ